ncbi:hypothetical protein CEP52_002563 [Fusarium oligoseptatum]|uniref:SGNH hydrolase-type esterase domain-containing protein n=1 Tax=Fusarium oligoseptatum TaxID=2604345 RepID=A0A428UDK4_9HYPO|nr:hypothetical protein CEP52_002563 [Fusarium oligoseptatum]
MKLIHSFFSLWGIFLHLLLLGTTTLVYGHPHDVFHHRAKVNDSFGDLDGLEIPVLEKRAQPDLRVMALGASIVFGVGSTDGNGFRKLLRDQLRFSGYKVDMVGTKNGGTMKDNDVEATSGFIVKQIHDASKLSYKYKPNLVVINAGTNDIVGNIDPAGQPQRLKSMLLDLWSNISPDTVIIVSTILPVDKPAAEALRGGVNNGYRDVVSDLYKQGKPIYLADLDGFMSLSDLRKWRAHSGRLSRKLKKENKLKDPLPADTSNDDGGKTCRKSPGDGINAGALTQKGSGYDDGTYEHDSQEMGAVLTITSDWDRDQWFFARIFRSDRDDLLGWVENSAGNVVYAVRRNDGGGKFTKIATDLNVNDNCKPKGVVFIDLNGDGLDDFACIGPDGAVYASINQGNGGGDKPPSFVYKGLWRAADSRFPQAKVRLADIDGDGRADFCGLSDNGDVYVWRNGWIDDMPGYWQALGKRFEGKGMGNLEGTRFEDLNGDGRDDWIWVGDKGEAHTWTNSRSCGVGKEGDGLKVAWRPGYYKGKTSGPTHTGGFASGIRNRIHFARIYGEPQDFGLLGRLDYVYMEHTKGSNGKHTFRMRVWKNKGYGATKPKADGNKYCDMTGNGRDDYVWVLSKGEMDLYPNGGKNFITGQESYWGPMQKAFFKPDRDLDRRDLHLTDWDGDGKCDIVWVDPNNQNRVSVWRNNYTPGGGFNWQYLANPAPELYCPEKRGIGFQDIPVQFADVSGSGRSDYLCIEKNGRIWGWTQDANGAWTYIDQFFSSKKHDRANMRFADVDGDGRDDAIWVEKFSGDAFVYYNMGRRDIAGSRYWWEIQERGGPFPAYGGSYAGSCQYFPDLNGDGRADLHSIQGTFPNTAVTAYNVCDGNRSGDDSTDIKKPDLIMPPETPSNGGGGEESNTPPNPGENCGLPQKWMQLPIKVGESDGGEDFCFAKWNQGVFPREIEAWATEGSLHWIRMVYNDGTQVTAGKKPPADNKHRYGTVKWDPWHDSFDKFSLYAGGFKNGVGRMVLELSDSCDSGKCNLDAGAYWPGGPPPEVDVPRGEKRDGMLLGFRLRAGDIIDSLTPLFSKSKPVKVTLRDAKFTPTWQELNARPFDGTKVTWSKEKGHEDGGEIGVTIGSEYSWEAAVPEVVTVKNGKKIEVSAKYVGKQIRRDSQATDAYSNCFDIDEDDEDDRKDADAADFVITESGTYCPDGERVGNTGMSDSELLNACPI